MARSLRKHCWLRIFHEARRGLLTALLLAALTACSSGGGGGGGGTDPTPAPAARSFAGEIEPWTGPGDPFADDTSRMVTLTSAFTVTQASYTLTGTVASGVTVLTVARGDQAPANVAVTGGGFSVPLTLVPGGNTLHLTVTDGTGTLPRYNPVIVYDRSGQAGGVPSSTLIDNALAGGTITGEQALSYRIFAAFGDARLPAQYQGDDSLADYQNVISDLTATIPYLSETAKDELGPFLAPDIYTTASTTIVPKPAGRIVRAPTTLCNPLRSTDCVVSNTWTSVAGNTIRVWYDAMRSGDRDKANAVLAALDGPAAAWGKLASIMQVIPIPDQGRATFYGIDDKLDILLTNLAIPGITTPSVTDANNHVPVFIRLKRTLSTDLLVGAAVHELMHAFQYALQLANGAGPTAYHTFSEGTADWAIWHVLPKNPFPNQHNYAYFQEPNRELTSVKDANTDRFPYATWMFFMYLSKKYDNNIIGQVWQQATSKTDQVDILKTVASGRGKQLDEIWHDWAISFWNGGPKQEERRHDLADWAGIKDNPVTTTNEQALPQPLDTEYLMRTYDLPALAMEYHRFTFPTEEARTLLLLDGWTNVLGKESPLVTGSGTPLQAYAVYPPPDPSMVQGARIQVTYQVNGSWEDTVNFTDNRLGGTGANMWHYQTICRDLTEQRMDTMVVTLSYADVSAPGKIFNAQGQLPRLNVSNTFCGKIRGAANLSTTVNGVTQQISLAQFDYEGMDYGMPSVAQPGGFVIYGRQFLLKSGTVNNWSISGTDATSKCAYAGSWSGTISSGGTLASYTFSTDIAKRAYLFPGFAASSPQKANVNITCPKGTGTETRTEGMFIFGPFGFKQYGAPPPVNLDTAYFTADGTILQGDATHMSSLPPAVNSGTWTIRNMPE